MSGASGRDGAPDRIPRPSSLPVMHFRGSGGPTIACPRALVDRISVMRPVVLVTPVLAFTKAVAGAPVGPAARPGPPLFLLLSAENCERTACRSPQRA